MTPDAIRAAFAAAGDCVPQDALRAAAGQAEILAPDIRGLLEKAVRGSLLLMEEENLLFFGLYAMAAARDTSFCPTFLQLLHGSELPLMRILGEDWQELARPLCSLFTTATMPRCWISCSMPGHSTTPTHLALDGGADRAALVALLDRFDREALAKPGEMVWIGWQDAILALGLSEFTERVRHAWKSGCIPFWSDADEIDWLQQMQQAAEGEQPDAVTASMAAIDDPVTSLAWLKPSAEGPFRRLGLSWRELNWLDWALLAKARDGACMSLEEADGFFTGILCGPRPAPFSEHEAALWRDKSPDDVFEPGEVQRTIRDLLKRHYRSVAERLADEEAPEPFHEDTGSKLAGGLWAQGFAKAIGLDVDRWRKLQDHKYGADTLIPLLLPGMDTTEIGELSSAGRRAILRDVPKLVLSVRRFWRDGVLSPPPLSSAAPRSGPKVGRNESCPCGSGRKFKKCCGAAA